MQRARHDHSTKIKEMFRLLHQKKLIRAIAHAGVLFGMPVVGVYGTYVAIRKLQLDHVHLPLQNNHADLKGLSIAQISDLHYGPTNFSEKYFDEVIRIIHSQKPDLIVLTGDYYQWDPSYISELPRILSRLSAPLGVYAVLGNHDYGACYPGRQGSDPFDHEFIKSEFEKNGLHVLTNDSVVLNFHGQDFNLVGMHDLWSGLFDPDQAMQNINADHPTIVLSHNPDSAPLIHQDYDLMLSGHVHGGQVSFPVIGPLAVPVENRKMMRGLHKLSDRKHVYVNRGLGYNFKLRLNSPPEITLIEMV